MLSPVLLERLRAWWRVGHAQGKILPHGWLFPGLDPMDPLTARQLNRAIHAAAQDALGRSLFDSIETVRALSARALGNIKDSHSSERLMRALNSDTSTMVRMQAALALKKIKDPLHLDALKNASSPPASESKKQGERSLSWSVLQDMIDQQIKPVRERLQHLEAQLHAASQKNR